MKYLQRLLLAAALAAGVSAPALAQQAQGGQAAQAVSDLTDGEVRKVDKPAGKITLKHGEIKQLDMPPMTMVFGVSDRAMLDKVKAGDKVRFRVANQGGQFTVTDIQAPAR